MDEEVDNHLEHDELVILAGLLRELVRTDGEISEEETEALAGAAIRLGVPEERWLRVWTQASRELPNESSVKAAAATLARQAARELVYEIVHDVASADEIVDPEWDLLEWLDEEWQSRYA